MPDVTTAAPNTHLAPYAARGLKGRILSGVQPTGNLHLGNYLGAIRNFARLQHDYECLYCVVDLHAITQPQDPKLLAAQTREIAAAFLAAGVDGKKQIIFNQSMVPAHAQLAWVFNCVARVGWMNRMTQFKEKAGKDRENASLGLYAYPALMAADILIYKATHVPVGEDQKQHLELTRDIAIKFNNDFNAPDFFPITEPLIFGAATRVMSLRDGTKKMSKSDPSDYSRINLTDDADAIAQKIRRAKTDPLPMPDTPGRRGEAARCRQSPGHLRRPGRSREGRRRARLRRQAVLRVQGGADRAGGGQAGADRRGDAAADEGPRPCRRRPARRRPARLGPRRADPGGGLQDGGIPQALMLGARHSSGASSHALWTASLRLAHELERARRSRSGRS